MALAISEPLILNVDAPPVATRPAGYGTGNILDQVTIDFHVTNLSHTALKPEVLFTPQQITFTIQVSYIAESEEELQAIYHLTRHIVTCEAVGAPPPPPPPLPRTLGL